MTAPDDIAKLRAIAEAATPEIGWTSGVWYGADEGGWAAIGPHHELDDLADGQDDPGSEPHQMAKRDAAFIAAASPGAVLSLLDEIEALRREVERLRAPAQILADVRDDQSHEVARLRAEVERLGRERNEWRDAGQAVSDLFDPLHHEALPHSLRMVARAAKTAHISVRNDRDGYREHLRREFAAGAEYQRMYAEACTERDAAIRDRDEERQHHELLSAQAHDVARKTCRSLASQVETLTTERDAALSRAEKAEGELADLKEHHGRVVTQRNRDWDALMVEIAKAIGTDEDREAAEMEEMDEFDPWRALRAFTADRDKEPRE